MQTRMTLKKDMETEEIEKNVSKSILETLSKLTEIMSENNENTKKLIENEENQEKIC